MTFIPSVLRVNDRVGIQPSGMGEKLYRFGTVTKVLKTQLTVTDNKTGVDIRFKRNTGRGLGTDLWYPCRIVSSTVAKEHNAKIQPRFKRRVTLYKLSDKIKNADSDTFSQRQLDMATVILNDKNGADLPPHEPDPGAAGYPEGAKVSIRVLVKLNGHELRFGRYFHGLESWNIEGVGGTEDPEVIEWWSLP